MGSTGGNSIEYGLNDDYVITKYSPNVEQKRMEFYQMLKKSGYFGYDQTAIDNAFKNMDEYSTDYPSFDEYKNTMIAEGNFPSVDGTLSQGVAIYYNGASIDGYGSGNDAREKWDNKYNFSSFIDHHKELWLNTNSTLYRGLRLDDNSMKNLYKALSSGNTIDFIGPSSWSLDSGVANFFAEISLVGQENKNIVIFQDVTKGIRNAMPFPHGTDSEVIYSGTSKFSVIDISQDNEGVYYVKVKKTKK